MIARISKSRYFWIPKLIVLFLVSVAFSITVAQWLHEFGHILIALVSGSPITEYVFWPPWQQHVTADFNSVSWALLSRYSGFLITVSLFSGLFVFFAFKRSKWAYVLIFPLFQTLATSHGDLTAVGIHVPFDIVWIFGWIVPFLAFYLLALFYRDILITKGSQ